MSGIDRINTSTCHGPRKLSRLDLMGIRFLDDPTNPTGTGAGGGEYKAPETQEELNRIIADRLSRERDKFKDFDTLKEKAAKYDAAQTAGAPGASQGGDVTERLTEFEQRVSAAEQKASQTEQTLASTQAELARKDVALTKGIGAAQLPLLTASTKEELEKQADAILAITRGTGVIPGQGGGGGDSKSGLDAGRAEWEKRHPKKN
jgi:hypothetical protein